MILLPGASGPLVNVKANMARRGIFKRQDITQETSQTDLTPSGTASSSASVLARQSALTVTSSLTIIYPTYTSFSAPSSATAAAVTSTNPNPSNPSSKQLGLAIGASIGVPIGVIILLASGLTCLWQWKRRSGPIGAIAIRREERLAAKQEASGSHHDDKDLDGVGMKKLEAGFGRKKKRSLNQSSSQGSRKKSIDLMAASLAAKSSVAAKEAMADAELYTKRNSQNQTSAPSAMKQRFARLEASVSPHRRSRPAATPFPNSRSGEQKQTSSDSAKSWPVQMEGPDPPMAPPGVMQDHQSTTPVKPLRSHPPPMPPPKDDHLPSPGQYRSSQQYLSSQSYSRPLPPRSQPPQEPQPSQPSQFPPRTPTKSRAPLSTHYENYPSDSYNEAIASDTPDDADISEEEDVSALPPLPAPTAQQDRPRKSRSNPLLKRTSLLHKRSNSGRGAGHSDSEPRQSSSHSHHTAHTSSLTGMLGRRGSNESHRPGSVSSYARSSRPTSPKSVSDSLPRTSPAFHVQAELQRRSQERLLWEQRRMIGESYGRLMRDWDAGPVRRIGDGRDFVEDGGAGGGGGYARAAGGNSRSGLARPASAGNGLSPSPRIPTLRGPGSRGERRDAEPRGSSSGDLGSRGR